MSLDLWLETENGETGEFNITHNLIDMWKESGLYEALYLKEGARADEVLPMLRAGLQTLLEDEAHFVQYDASNKWGTYKQAVPWLDRVIESWERHPEGVVQVSN